MLRPSVISVIVVASVVLAVELASSVALWHYTRRANSMAVDAAAGQGNFPGRETEGRYVRAYAPLSLRLESAAKLSARDGSATLVFASSPGAPEGELAKDVRARAVSRLVISGVLVDLVPGSKPAIDLKTGDVAIRVAPSSAMQTPGIGSAVQPVSVAVGAEMLARSALSSPDATHPGGIVRVIVVGLTSNSFQ